MIKIITGIRRSGKSYLLNVLFTNYLDREENKLYYDSKSLNSIDDSFKKIIVVKDNIKLWRSDDGILIIGIQEFLLNKDSLDL